MSAPQRPDYRANDLTPGQRYFDCRGLRATISTWACAQRWQRRLLEVEPATAARWDRLHHG